MNIRRWAREQRHTVGDLPAQFAASGNSTNGPDCGMGGGSQRHPYREKAVAWSASLTRRRFRESASIYEMSFVHDALRAGDPPNCPGGSKSREWFRSSPFRRVPLPGGPIKTKGLPYLVSLRGGDVPFGAESRLGSIHFVAHTSSAEAIYEARGPRLPILPGSKRCQSEWIPPKVHLIPNGVDTEYFRPLAGFQQRKEGPFRPLSLVAFRRKKNLFWLLVQLAAGRRTSPSRV